MKLGILVKGDIFKRQNSLLNFTSISAFVLKNTKEFGLVFISSTGWMSDGDMVAATFVATDEK